MNISHSPNRTVLTPSNKSPGVKPIKHDSKTNRGNSLKLVVEHSDYHELLGIELILKDLSGGYVAGGCFKNLFTGNKPKDLDVFFYKEDDLLKAIVEMTAKADVYKQSYHSDNVACFVHIKTGFRLELNKRNVGTPKEVINKFDFSIARFAMYYDYEDSEVKVVYDADFFKHLHLHRLVIDNEILFPISTFERSYRYARYGYNLCRESKEKLVTAIQNTTDVDFSKDFYAGID